MPQTLTEITFRNPARARAAFIQLSAGRDLQSRLEPILSAAPDPDTALAYLISLRQQKPEAFERLAAARFGLQYLIAIFSNSRFLSEEILQNPQAAEELLELSDLHRVRLIDEYSDRLEAHLRASGLGPSEPPPALTLSAFRRRQVMRILLRDVQGFGALSEITEEISNLADAILQVSYRRLRLDLERRFGCPRSAGDGAPAGFAVIGLGKLGGRELNYSSDIDLMFLYSENGETDGARPISNKEFFKKLASQLTDLLSTYTAEGLCYRVDLRLRPEGRLGEVCISVDGAKQYYQSRARDWELQMLIKARVAAGDTATGRALLDPIEDLIYSTTLDFSAVESMSATRDRIDERLAAKRGGMGPSTLDVKLTRGGIRDIEFLVQCLQRLHGGRVPWVRHGGTLMGLSRLHDKNLLSPTEYWRLASAYQFLRHLEHRMQVLDDRQTHSLPADTPELDVLARRMPPSHIGSEASQEQLLRQLNLHFEQVIEIYERVIHAQKPIYYTLTAIIEQGPEAAPEPGPLPPEAREPELLAPPAPAFGNLIRSLDETSPALASRISASGLNRGLRAFEHFLERVVESPEWMYVLDSDAEFCSRVLDLFEHSPYFSEQLIREPQLLEQVRTAGDGGMDYTFATDDISDQAGLRRFFRQELMRLMTASICLRTPVFDTLARTSDLADAVIRTSYRMALAQTLASHPPQTPGYQAKEQLMVVALGRLGMREFDVASDADLVFVIPDEDSVEQHFWTRVAERTVDLITAYTGEGVMFQVDTRLRPNGREGALVQSVSACKDYFAKTAEAWEGIAWMKARAIAGHTERATEFLNAIQQVDWRRYGQGGRSKKDLRQMRARLEKEQGGLNPLKAGRGGYYDIDFALMYLRLKGAGLFFKVLNTPERIDIIEKMGHLDRDDAAFFGDAAMMYRAVDHALRVYSGHAEGSLPNTDVKLHALQALVRRWTPDRLNDEPLENKLQQIRNQTRAMFDRLFA